MLYHEIALALHMPVYILERDMPYEEFLRWCEFFKVQPQGWREDHRTYMLMRAFGTNASEESLFPSIRAIKEHEPVDTKRLPKGKFLTMMLNAKGGDTSDWKPPWLS